MKVKTDLKAGGLLQDVSEDASKYANQATDFVAKAGKEADQFTGQVSKSATSMWNCFRNSFNW